MNITHKYRVRLYNMRRHHTEETITASSPRAAAEEYARLYDNITYGRPIGNGATTRICVSRIATDAGAHDFIVSDDTDAPEYEFLVTGRPLYQYTVSQAVPEESDYKYE